MHLCKLKNVGLLSEALASYRNPILQDAHRMGILDNYHYLIIPSNKRILIDWLIRTMKIGCKKHWRYNHAYSRLLQWIACELSLSNLSNKLKDTKANQSTRSKNPTTSLQLAIHFMFSSLPFLSNLVTSFYMVNWQKFRTSQLSFFSSLFSLSWF